MHQGNGDRSDEERRERERRRGQQEPQPEQGVPWEQVFACAAGGVLLAGTAWGAVKLYNALSDADAEPSAEPLQTSGSTSWFSFRRSLNYFWERTAEESQNDALDVEHQGGHNECSTLLTYQSGHSVRRYRNKYNKFDRWFENLLRSIRCEPNQKYKLAFEECFETVLKEMQNVDSLFKFLYRDFRPAGSSFEELKLNAYDEFDVNLVLSSLNMQDDVEVEDFGSGHVAICLSKGFLVRKEEVTRKFGNDPKLDSYYTSITAKLKNWMTGYYVNRTAVMKWLQSTVDLALLKIQQRDHNWNHVEFITRSTSGPAVTLKIRMKDGRQLSLDLVPVFEFNMEHLPTKIQSKVEKIAIKSSRTWYAVPKGPTRQCSPEIWRTSLYEVERDVMRGHNHLKPAIKILKGLRDVQNWNNLSSYYLKTTFLWLMDDQNNWNVGLGQIVMMALKALEDHLKIPGIDYYWDPDLNLLKNIANDEFFTNVSSCLNNIVKTFEKSLEDDTIDPMRFFGCDKEGNIVRPSHPQPVSSVTSRYRGFDDYNGPQLEEINRSSRNFSPTRSPVDPNCIVM